MNTINLTLIVVAGIVLSTQVIALYLQYRVNRTYQGIGHWLLGSSFMALSFILMPMVAIGNAQKLAIVANPLLILGHLFLYVGVRAFFNKKLNKWIPISIFTLFSVSYYCNMFIGSNISARTVVISVALSLISFLIAYELFFGKEEYFSGTVNFISGIFFIYGSLNVIRIFFTIMASPGDSYLEQGYSIMVTMFISIIMTNLWTLGLIIMVNQRLNRDNELEKEKLQTIFNTSIDAQLITRLQDGFIFDVNEEFSLLTGYPKLDVIGNYTMDIDLWLNLEDRQRFIEELNHKGHCQNMDFIFRRKNGTRFAGIISARIIIIHFERYIINVIRDVTERKAIEVKMDKLVEQLEIERNTAQLNAITDSLSGLFNRGYFDNTLRVEFFRLKRSGGALSLIMLDIDHFKKFNDTYGHLAGDKCIQMIAKTLQSIIERAPDVVARYGGEEFIVILPETDEEGAKHLGEMIRQGIENLAIPHVASETADFVTVSLGIVTLYPAQLESPEQLVKLVDDALYEAKKTGRNRCVFFSQNQIPENKEINNKY